MKPELLEILVCPVCRGKLELEVESEENSEIIAGNLSCASCNLRYTINDGIPNMLPPEINANS